MAAEADATMEGLGIESENVLTRENARRVLAKVDNALDRVNGMRANLGALQSRLMATVNNLSIADENLSAAKSRVADVDVAHESSELSKHTILQKAGISNSRSGQYYSSGSPQIGSGVTAHTSLPR